MAKKIDAKYGKNIYAYMHEVTQKKRNGKGGVGMQHFCDILLRKILGVGYVNSLLILQNFTTARKSGNIIFT